MQHQISFLCHCVSFCPAHTESCHLHWQTHRIKLPFPVTVSVFQAHAVTAATYAGKCTTSNFLSLSLYQFLSNTHSHSCNKHSQTHYTEVPFLGSFGSLHPVKHMRLTTPHTHTQTFSFPSDFVSLCLYMHAHTHTRTHTHTCKKQLHTHACKNQSHTSTHTM